MTIFRVQLSSEKVVDEKLTKISPSIIIIAGEHNNNEKEEGEGRSAKHPRGRLKFQNFPTVVVLQSLDMRQCGAWLPVGHVSQTLVDRGWGLRLLCM